MIVTQVKQTTANVRRMSALSEEIHRSFTASEHAVPVTSAHRPLGRRQLGGWSVLAQAVSTTAPAASMVILATMMHRVLEPVRALVVVTVVILVLCLIAACLAQLTARMAASGGLYSFVARGIGPRSAGAVACGLMVKFLGSAAMSVMHIGLTLSAMAAAIGWPPLTIAGTTVTAVVLAGGIGLVVARGVRHVTVALLVIEVCALAFVLGLLMIPSTIVVGALAPLQGGETYRLVMFALFALAGFESAAFLGPETRRGLTTVSRVIRWTPALCGVLVIGAGIAALTGRGDLMVSAYLHGTSQGAPAPIVLTLHLALACSWLGSATGSANAVSRLIYTLGLERVLPRPLGVVHQRLRTPSRAVAAAAAIIGGLAVLLLAFGTADGLGRLVSTAVRMGLMLSYLLMVVAMVALLTRLRELTRPVALTAVVGVTALLGVLGVILAGELRHGSVVGLAVIIALLAGGPVWMGLHMVVRPRRQITIGVFDRHESDDALPGGAEVRRTDRGDLTLASRQDPPTSPDRWG